MISAQDIEAIRKWEKYKFNCFIDFMNLDGVYPDKKMFEEQCVIFTVYMNAINKGRQFHEETSVIKDKD